jgi:FG-GAP repeat
MRNDLAITVLIMLSASGAVTAADFGACGVERASSWLLDRAGATCLSATATVTICEEIADTVGVTISVRRGDRELRRWRGADGISFQRNFRVLVADLDGDGVDDIAIATHNETGNGMAISYWTVCAVDGKSLTAPPACVDVEDYGSVSYFIKGPGSAGCLLLQAEWRRGKEPKRGEGLYLVGQWLRYDRRRFVGEPSRPLIARRYLFSFESELRLHGDMPHAWFLDPGTRTVTCPEPLCQRSPGSP